MSELGEGVHLPRLAGPGFWRSVQEIHGRGLESITEVPFYVQKANFHVGGDRVSEHALREWRTDLTTWARDNGFPHEMNSKKRSQWDVDLGTRLHEDTRHLPEASHPHVWCWIAVNLLPHLVAHRWGWPEVKEDGEIPTGTAKWSRFGPSLKNGLLLATYRIATYGPELSLMASEQEFQSLQNRPSFGRDRRVARIILEVLVESLKDPDTHYGRKGEGTRAKDCDDICQELQRVNSMRPLCFRTDEEIESVVSELIERLPEYRRPANDHDLDPELDEESD